jgi:hypothetical protein
MAKGARVMIRLIDDMSAKKIYDILISNTGLSLQESLEKLCAPVPAEWYDTLDPDDDQTWVLCDVGYDHPSIASEIVWVGKYNEGDVYRFGIAGSWKKQFYRYATPVDLNIRYKGKER